MTADDDDKPRPHPVEIEGLHPDDHRYVEDMGAYLRQKQFEPIHRPSQWRRLEPLPTAPAQVPANQTYVHLWDPVTKQYWTPFLEGGTEDHHQAGVFREERAHEIVADQPYNREVRPMPEHTRAGAAQRWRKALQDHRREYIDAATKEALAEGQDPESRPTETCVSCRTVSEREPLWAFDMQPHLSGWGVLDIFTVPEDDAGGRGTPTYGGEEERGAPWYLCPSCLAWLTHPIKK